MEAGADSCAKVDEVLLDYAYGELDGAGKDSVERHLAGCAKCREAFAALSQTRRVMAALTPEPAPDAGLESLLAYAQQHAERRSVEAAAPRRSAWRWLVPALPVGGLLAVLVAVVSRQDPASVVVPPPSAPAVYSAKAEAAQARKTAGAAPAEPEMAAGNKDTLAAGDGKLSMLDEKKSAERLAIRDDAPASAPVAGEPGVVSRRAVVAKASPAPQRESQGVAEAPGGGAGLGLGGIALEGRRSGGAAQAFAAKEQERRAAPEAKKPAEAPAPPPPSGTAIGGDSWARAPAQTPVLGAIAQDRGKRLADKSARDEEDEALSAPRTVEIMSNAMVLPETKAKRERVARSEAPAQPAARAQPVPQAEAAADVAFAKGAGAAAEDDDFASDLDAARAASARGDHSGAVAILNRTIASGGPGTASGDAQLMLAEELWRSGAPQAAAEAFRRFAAQFPSHPRAPYAALARVQLLEQLRRDAEAASAFAELQRRWPDSSEARTPRPGASGPHAAPAAPSRSFAPADALESAPAPAKSH